MCEAETANFHHPTLFIWLKIETKFSKSLQLQLFMFKRDGRVLNCCLLFGWFLFIYLYTPLSFALVFYVRVCVCGFLLICVFACTFVYVCCYFCWGKGHFGKLFDYVRLFLITEDACGSDKWPSDEVNNYQTRSGTKVRAMHAYTCTCS